MEDYPEKMDNFAFPVSTVIYHGPTKLERIESISELVYKGHDWPHLLEFPLYYIDLSTVRFDEFEKSVASVSLQALSVLVKNMLNLDNYLQYIDIISDNSELLSPYIDDYTHLTYSACQNEWRKKIMDEFVLATHMDYAQLKEKVVTNGPAGQYFADRGKAEGKAKAKAEYDKETAHNVGRPPCLDR